MTRAARPAGAARSRQIAGQQVPPASGSGELDPRSKRGRIHHSRPQAGTDCARAREMAPDDSSAAPPSLDLEAIRSEIRASMDHARISLERAEALVLMLALHPHARGTTCVADSPNERETSAA